MPRTPMKDLEGFNLYLQDVLGPTSASIYTYCSMVRRVIRAVPTLTEEKLTEYFYTELSATARSNIRAAWNQYVRYMKDVKSTVVPSPGYVRAARKNWEKTFQPGGPLPADVMEAIWKLVNVRRWPVSVITRGTWNMIVERPESPRLGNRALVFAVGKMNYWPCSEDDLAPLRRWALPNGGPGVGVPILPREPEATAGYPATTLTEALARVIVRPEMMVDHPLQREIPAIAPVTHVQLKPPPKPKVSDEVGRPCSVEELSALMTANSPPPVRENPNFYFVLDARVAAERKPPEGMRSRSEIEAERAAGPARTSAVGSSFHARLDAELALYEAWERGEEVTSVDRPAPPSVDVEPFVFDLDEE